MTAGNSAPDGPGSLDFCADAVSDVGLTAMPVAGRAVSAMPPKCRTRMLE